VNLKKRIDQIEASLNGGKYATLEDIVAGTNTHRPLPPAYERFFNQIENEKKENEL